MDYTSKKESTRKRNWYPACMVRFSMWLLIFDREILLDTPIAKYSKESYLIALYKKYQDTVKTEDELLKREIDYADEITYNAKIIVQKYKCFKNAWYVDFMEDYEEIEAIVQRMKSEICEIYESISQ